MIISRPNASAVSRALRRRGFRPLPSGTSRNREGIRVSQAHGHVTVTADIDRLGNATELVDEMMQALAACGYRVERMSATRLWVLA